MKIETKYKIDDTLWFLHENKVRPSTVRRIDTCTNIKGTTVLYELKDWNSSFSESSVFPSKAELLKSL
jgi:hypothetical protein